jgi:hypothetical protein
MVMSAMSPSAHASLYREEDDRNLRLAASGNGATALSPRPSPARARGSRWRDRLTLFFDRRGCARSEPAEDEFPWPGMPFAARISFAEHRCYSVAKFLLLVGIRDRISFAIATEVSYARR